MIYQGNSFGWLRFFMYGIPSSYLLIIGIWQAAPILFKQWYGVFTWSMVILALLGSNVSSWLTMDKPLPESEERFVTCKIIHPNWVSSYYTMQGTREVSNFIEQLPSQKDVLLDTYLGFALPLVSTDATHYVITSDRDFLSTVAQPYGKVDYILIPKPEGIEAGDSINRQYPTLWQSGSSWTVLTQEFASTREYWKLYKVVAQPQASIVSGTALVGQPANN